MIAEFFFAVSGMRLVSYIFRYQINLQTNNGLFSLRSNSEGQIKSWPQPTWTQQQQ